MTTSATAIWIICVVLVAGLAIWLVGVALAARKPYVGHAQGQQLRGSVQGGMHIGPALASVWHSPRRAGGA